MGFGQAFGLGPFGLDHLWMIEMRRCRRTGRRQFRPGSGRSAHIAVDQAAHPESHGEGHAQARPGGKGQDACQNELIARGIRPGGALGRQVAHLRASQKE